MANYDNADFFRRLVALFPKRWAGSKAFKPPSAPGVRDSGKLYALLYSLAGGLTFVMGLWAYVRLQTRLATLSDEFADLASLDFFSGRLPRKVGELDAIFTSRLRLHLIAPTGTQNAVVAAAQQYFVDFPSPGLSYVDGFDLQSDPARALFYGITDAQFAIIMYYPVALTETWFVGQSFLGQSTVLVDPNAFSISQTADPELVRRINDVKDWTYRAIYIIARGDATGSSLWDVGNWDEGYWR